jgi:hypothetical protein
MGVRLTPGTVTVTPTSPSSQSIVATVSADQNTVQIDGIAYQWHEANGCYQQRIPPPPTNPPGEWRRYYFGENEQYDRYDTDASTGNSIWTEHGVWTWNG